MNSKLSKQKPLLQLESLGLTKKTEINAEVDLLAHRQIQFQKMFIDRNPLYEVKVAISDRFETT